MIGLVVAPLSRSKAGLMVVIRVCWLEWCVSCDELVGWSWLMIFNLIVPMRSWSWFRCFVSSGIGGCGVW